MSTVIYEYVQKPYMIELCVSVEEYGIIRIYVDGFDSCGIDIPREVATDLAREILKETAND